MGYLVWYSGDCGTPTQPLTCNSVSLNASPNPVTVGNSINLTISGDASTWISDNFGGGVTNCSGSWNSKTCTAQNPGTYSWTHTWKHCEGNVDNCSSQCSQSTNYTVLAAVTPTPTYHPTRTPRPPVPPQGGPIINNNVTNTNTSTNTQNQTNNQTVNVTTATSTPRIVTASIPVVEELPKTGLPLAAWALSGLVPAGLGLKRFGISKNLRNTAHFIWQKREFLKED
jgi:hypothetical protein